MKKQKNPLWVPCGWYFDEGRFQLVIELERGRFAWTLTRWEDMEIIAGNTCASLKRAKDEGRAALHFALKESAMKKPKKPPSMRELDARLWRASVNWFLGWPVPPTHEWADQSTDLYFAIDAKRKALAARGKAGRK